MWRAKDPAATAWAKLSDDTGTPIPDSPEFLVGHYPPPLVSRIDALQFAMGKTMADGENVYLDSDKIMARNDAARAFYIEAVRWGVRDWRGFTDEAGNEIPCEIVTEKVGKREFPALSQASLDFLESNRLVVFIGVQVTLFQHMTAEEKKASAWLAEVSTKSPNTNAVDAGQASHPKTTDHSPRA